MAVDYTAISSVVLCFMYVHKALYLYVFGTDKSVTSREGRDTKEQTFVHEEFLSTL